MRFTGFVVLVAAAAAAAVAVAVTAAPASANAVEVGHRVEMLTVAGSCPAASQPCDRPVKVHMWYPADHDGFADAPRSQYTSALYGNPLPAPYLPLSWTVQTQLARESDAIDSHGPRLPVIVFSHGSTNDPLDYAHTLERIAAEGFVVAAPYHVNNTQDDARIDFVNNLTPAAPTFRKCSDGLDWRPPMPPPGAPCSRASVPASMQERTRDVSRILDALPGWFGDRVDVDRAGLMGHSRGTVTALTAAGGSSFWEIDPLRTERGEPRVKAIMGMAIGVQNITSRVDFAEVTVPTVLVAGGKDTNSVQAVSEFAFGAIASADKLFVALPNATHRSFDSTYCAQLQSAGAAFDVDPRDGVVDQAEAANQAPVLDRHTLGLIGESAPGFLSGKAVHYCAERYFTGPVDIRRVVASTPNSEYACDATSCAIAPPVAGPPSVCVTSSIPCTGLDTDEVKAGMTQIAVAFFDSALKRRGGEGMHFTRYLAPKWLTHHVPMVGRAEAYAGPDAICPPGQGVICAK